MVEYHYDGGSDLPIHLEENTWNPERRLERLVVCSPYRNPQRSLFRLARFWYPNPSNGLGCVRFPSVRVDLFGQFSALFGCNGFHPIYTSSVLALVILRHPPYC